MLPVATDEAELVVPLGLAHHDPVPAARLHLDQLRRPVRERDVPARAVHVLGEDDVPAVRDPLRDAAHAAGLRADQVVVGTEEREAWIRVHERGDGGGWGGLGGGGWGWGGGGGGVGGVG